MSSHARSASANEIHAEPDAEPHSDWISEEDWNNYIKEDPRGRLRLSSVVSIFRVPKFLKDTKIEAYVPQRVSLGPYHHGSAELRPMGHHKGRALRRMMESFNTNRNLAIDSNNMDFADLAREEILKLEKKIRDSYEENIDCDGETLARMLSLDGCFILEVLKSLGDEAGQYYEPIFGEEKLQYAASDILKDILKLENQVPLIVLLKLQELEINSADDESVEDISTFFNPLDNENSDINAKKLLHEWVEDISSLFNPFDKENSDKKQSWPKPGEQQVQHILGFLHTVVVSPSFKKGECVDQGECSISIKCCTRQCIRMLQQKNKANDVESIPRAVELRKAGIKFKRCDGGIKEIKFDPNSATIFLPLICITDYTEIAFRNLIAFEMCKPFKIKNYVSLYMNLMDDLIDSEEDVALLRRKGVLTNRLGSDQEVADLFNCLGKEVGVSMENEFNELTKKVNAHYNNKMKVRVAELVRDHFSSPWRALALAAAIVILLLTAVQTIFSIISVYK